MKLLSKFGDLKSTYLTWLVARIGKSLVTAEKNSVTGVLEFLGPDGAPAIVIAADAPSDADGRPDGVVYIQTEA